jgi:hypothetical protein
MRRYKKRNRETENVPNIERLEERLPKVRESVHVSKVNDKEQPSFFQGRPLQNDGEDYESVKEGPSLNQLRTLSLPLSHRITTQ